GTPSSQCGQLGMGFAPGSSLSRPIVWSIRSRGPSSPVKSSAATSAGPSWSSRPTRNSTLPIVAKEAPALEADAEAVGQDRLPEVAAAGPQAEQVILAPSLDAHADLEFRAAHAQLSKLVGTDVGAEELVDRGRPVVGEALDFHVAPAQSLGVAQVQRLH